MGLLTSEGGGTRANTGGFSSTNSRTGLSNARTTSSARQASTVGGFNSGLQSSSVSSRTSSPRQASTVGGRTGSTDRSSSPRQASTVGGRAGSTDRTGSVRSQSTLGGRPGIGGLRANFTGATRTPASYSGPKGVASRGLNDAAKRAAAQRGLSRRDGGGLGLSRRGAGGYAEERGGYGDFTGGGSLGYDKDRGPYVSPSEVNRMARTLLGELDPRYPEQDVKRGYGYNEAQVMVNRLRESQMNPSTSKLFGSNMTEVTRPSQFSAWADPDIVDRMTSEPYNSPNMIAAREVASRVVSGQTPNLIGTRTHYANLDVANPTWQGGLDLKMGPHTFGRDPNMAPSDGRYDPSNQANLARAPGGFGAVPVKDSFRPQQSVMSTKSDRIASEQGGSQFDPGFAQRVADMMSWEDAGPPAGPPPSRPIAMRGLPPRPGISQNPFDVERGQILNAVRPAVIAQNQTARRYTSSYPWRDPSPQGVPGGLAPDVVDLATKVWGGAPRPRSPAPAYTSRFLARPEFPSDNTLSRRYTGSYPSRGGAYSSLPGQEADIAQMAASLWNGQFGEDRTRSPGPPLQSMVAARQEFPGRYPAAPRTRGLPAASSNPDVRPDNYGQNFIGGAPFESGIKPPGSPPGGFSPSISVNPASSVPNENDGVWDPTVHTNFPDFMTPFVTTGAFRKAVGDMPFNVPFRDMMSGVPKPADPNEVNAEIARNTVVKHLENRPPKRALPASPKPAAPRSSSPPKIASAPVGPWSRTAQKDQSRILPEGTSPSPALTGDNPPLPGGGVLNPPAPPKKAQEPRKIAGLPKPIVPRSYSTPRVRTAKQRTGDGRVAPKRRKNVAGATRPSMPSLAVPSQSGYVYASPARSQDPTFEYWRLMGPQILARMMRGEPIGV